MGPAIPFVVVAAGGTAAVIHDRNESRREAQEENRLRLLSGFAASPLTCKNARLLRPFSLSFSIASLLPLTSISVPTINGCIGSFSLGKPMAARVPRRASLRRTSSEPISPIRGRRNATAFLLTARTCSMRPSTITISCRSLVAHCLPSSGCSYINAFFNSNQILFINIKHQNNYEKVKILLFNVGSPDDECRIHSMFKR